VALDRQTRCANSAIPLWSAMNQKRCSRDSYVDRVTTTTSLLARTTMTKRC